MNIAIIGSGIAGLSSAWHLKKQNHNITLYEANSYFGGHTHTIDVEEQGKVHKVDTGFLVFNDRTYPELISFFNEIKAPMYPSDMSLSIRVVEEDLEWNGSELSTLFASFKPFKKRRFWRMMNDVFAFNRKSETYLKQLAENPSITLGELLKSENYSETFINWYLLPMSSAIWSCPPAEMLKFPASTFLQFCSNHGLLQIFDRPVWKTLAGGNYQYVQKVTDKIDRAVLNEPVQRVVRKSGKVFIESPTLGNQTYDAVIFATHPPTTLALFKDQNIDEHNILSAFSYQTNEVVVHSDTSLLPSNPKLWAAWNYDTKTGKDLSSPVAVSYLINKLQPLTTQTPMIVSLNPFQSIDPELVHRRLEYEHPLFDKAALQAQKNLINIQGAQNTFFVGAWTGYGFHEDGFRSGKQISEMITPVKEVSHG